MPSTFFGLTVAYSGLNASQAQLNTTANNISNVETKGYSRQVVNVVASSALRAYQKFGTTGTGVTAESVTQLRDLYYDEKYWNNQSDLGFYDKKLYYMEQIESYYSETTTKSGFSTIYAKMFNALDTLKTNAGDTSVRNQFISDAQELCTYFNSVSQRLQDLQSSINDEVKTTVDQINAIAEKIALLNKQINTIEVQGGFASELRDQRALLIDELSQIVPVDAEETEVVNSNYPNMDTGATYFTVKINGQSLVRNYEYSTLKCQSRPEKYNQSDIDGLYDVVWADSDATFDCTATNMNGSLKAMFEVRDGNNSDNLKGKVQSTTGTSITISKPSIRDLNAMNLPPSGSILVNSTRYEYDSFEAKVDENDKIISYTFNLKKVLTSEEQTRMLGRSFEVGDTVDYMGIAYYQNQMNLFLRNFSEAFNNYEKSGVTYDGEPMGDFFTAKKVTSPEEWTMDDQLPHKDPDTTVYPRVITSESNIYYQITAANVRVAKDSQADPRRFATAETMINGVDAYDIVEKLLTLESKEKLFRGGGGDSFLKCIYADVTVDTQECDVFKRNYSNIQATIENQRMSVSGVDQDEEALDLIKFQNAYNLASKCIQTFTEIYDRLILETGV